MTEFSLSCPDPNEYFSRLAREAVRRHAPLSASLNLTDRCNLRCVHCYLPPRENGARQELTGAEWEGLLAQMAAEGCLLLLLTGGEPLARRDFGRLYRRAAELGFVVTVFTNATLVDEGVVSLFSEMPPRLVEATLYGATAAIYERMTGVSGSFARCVRGIDRLLEAGVTVHLKTVLTTINRHEIDAIRRFAESRGCRFRFDVAVSCRLDGDRRPAAWRVAPAEAAALEMKTPETAARILEMVAKAERTPPENRRFVCAAGTSSFHVSAEGRLRPCVMASCPSFSLRRYDFHTAWRRLMRAVASPVASSDLRSPCRSCRLRIVCSSCSSITRIEMGRRAVSRGEVGGYYCDLGAARLTAAEQCAKKERIRVP